MINNNFHKRFFSRPAEFFNIIKRIKKYIRLKKSIKEIKLDITLREKIMLAVCAVNNCKSCSYLHTKTSLENGVSSKEIKNLFMGELGEFPEHEAKAIAYAQHYTEFQANVSEEVRKSVVDYYGNDKTILIEFFVEIVNLGNISCNTVEAYKQGIVPDYGKLKFFFIFLLCLPIEYSIRKKGKQGKIFLKKNKIEIL